MTPAPAGQPADVTGLLDAIVIGAGMSGLYQLIRLRELGMTALVLEAGTGVGGTWYWNRYPGCRFDSESYSYGYSFDKDLLAEWDWSEHFAPQPETERYLNRVADKYDLRRDIRFRSRVLSARWDESSRSWSVELEDGTRFCSRFLITAIGALSSPTMPAFPGMDDFQGQSFHTGLWPKEPVDFAGKRVAVIGTGASGVQTIQEVAKTAAQLTVFQRTPNWCAPLHNAKIAPEEMAEIRTRYDEIFARCQETFACFLHTADPRNTFDVTAEEREAFLEKLYSERGFGIWVGNFKDLLTNREANAVVSEFIANKIRARVHDQRVAEMLIPKNHGFGTRRVPLETRYYEVYNQPNVLLVDSRATPIERITADRDQDQRGGVRLRHHRLCHRLRRAARRLRPHRLPRPRRRQPEGGLEGRRDVACGHAAGRVPEPVHAARPAYRAGQYPALDRVQRGLGDGDAAPPPGQRHHPRRAPARGRRGLDGARGGGGARPAVHGGRFLDDRREQQCRGQAGAARRALHRQRADLSRLGGRHRAAGLCGRLR